MKAGKNNFDEQIKAALEGLENVPRSANWDIFVDKLDATETVDAVGIDDTAFDSLIIAGLGGLEMDFDPSSWEALEEKMTMDEVLENAKIDELARQSLHNYEVPYQKSHWALMAERLEEEFSLRRKLYRYKVLELALMLLFIFTLINILPVSTTTTFEDLTTFDFELFKSKDDGKIPVFDHKSREKRNAEIEENTSNGNTPIDDNAVLNQQRNPDNNLVDTHKHYQNNWKNTAATQKITKVIPHKMPIVKKEVAPQQPNLIYISSENGKTGQTTVADDAGKPRNIQDILGSLDLPKAELLDFNRMVPSMILVPDKESISWRFSMVGNFEANYIFSPDNEELGSSQDTTLGYGYGGGVLGGFKKGKWGFEMGGIYNHKSYPPNFINQFNPNGNKNILESEYFQDIQLELLQIPLNLQYFVVNRPKWRVYASTGMTLNLLLAPLYQINETRAALFTGLPAPTPPNSEPDKSLRNKTEFPTGVLKGGNLQENSYLTAQFGLGIERSVGNRFSIFVQPNYQHYLSKNGLKPFRDKFYTLSLSVGTRVSLK